MITSTTRSVAIATAVTLAVGVAPLEAHARTLVKRRRLGGGVTYSVYRERKPAQRIRVLSVDLDRPSRLRVVLGSRELPGFERTSSMARRTGAIAAINGDYARPSGRPVMTFARTGRLVQSPLAWGRNFSVDSAESNTYVGHPKLRVEVHVSSLGARGVARVNNGRPGRKQLALFTRDGGRLETPPGRACSARLVPDEGPRLTQDESGVSVPYRVDRVRCRKEPLARRSGVVLAAPRDGTKAAFVGALRRGQRATLTWTLGWRGVVETIGGNPTLVEDGRIVVGKSSHPFFARHPRTGIGTSARGRVIMVTVDGRRRRYSVGKTLRGFARLFRSLGAEWALNLDGGGSTTMVVRGRVVNRPSDGNERAVSSALVVLPAAGGSSGSTSPSSPEPSAGRRLWDALATDPASTGGMASALQSEGMRLPGSLQRTAGRFSRRVD